MLDRDLRVLDRGDALDDERYVVLVRVLVLKSLDVVPREAGLEGGAFHGARAPGFDEPPDDVSLAPAVMGDVDRQAKSAIAVVLRAAHVIVDPGVVAAHVELEYADIARRARRFLEPRLAHGREHLRNAELRRRPRRRCGAAFDDG